jgi:hypothetical protein
MKHTNDDLWYQPVRDVFAKMIVELREQTERYLETEEFKDRAMEIKYHLKHAQEEIEIEGPEDNTEW